MRTQKSLRLMVPEILNHIKVSYQNLIVYNKKLIDIHKGNILPYLEQSIEAEMTKESFRRTKNRIIPINILSQIINKMSKVYMDPPVRDGGENEIDNELISYYEKRFDLNNKLATCNELLNINNYFALEVYLNSEGLPSLRILPADTFLVYSDSQVDPTEMTVFIKFMGTIKKEAKPVTDSYGRLVKNAEMVLHDVNVYYIYSDTEILKVDADGDIIDQMQNPLGTIPFVYCSKNSFDLIPIPDSTWLQSILAVPKLLTDINYATQYQSHSILYAVNADMSNLVIAPDVVWNIKGDSVDGAPPQIGVLKPDVDSDKVISFVSNIMQFLLDSKGLKTSGVGELTIQSAASGVAKMIDQADASASYKEQMGLFHNFENKLWKLLKVMHNYWVSTNQILDMPKAFSDDFEPAIKFGEVQAVINPKEILEQLKLEFEMGLTTPEMALLKLNPTYSDDQIRDMMVAINAYEQAKTISFNPFDNQQPDDQDNDNDSDNDYVNNQGV